MRPLTEAQFDSRINIALWFQKWSITSISSVKLLCKLPVPFIVERMLGDYHTWLGGPVLAMNFSGPKYKHQFGTTMSQRG